MAWGWFQDSYWLDSWFLDGWWPDYGVAVPSIAVGELSVAITAAVPGIAIEGAIPGIAIERGVS